MADAPAHVRSSALEAVPHGFFGRKGGESGSIADGFNCGWGAGDAPELVSRNRRCATDAILPRAPLASVHQVHSATAVVVEQPWEEDQRPAADALVTARRGVVLGIVTADCAPVLLADRSAGVVGAAHAGWRGAHGGVIEATIAAMEGLGARPGNITAAIGPTIAQHSYEVDDSFCQNFDPGEARFFAAGRKGHWHFDLPAYVRQRLTGCGVVRIDNLAIDTYANEDAYFSYRRATHREEPTYGRQISLIACG